MTKNSIENISIVIHVNIDDVNFSIMESRAKEYDLLKKDELHCTVIGTKTAEKLLNAGVKASDIKSLKEEFDWKISLEDTYYFVEKEYCQPSLEDPNKMIDETRSSIIQIVKMEALEEFYNKLRVLAGLDLELPVPHITLYTNSTREDKKMRGIGIYSQDELNSSVCKKL